MMPALLLMALLRPSHQATVLHGCLLKNDSTAVNERSSISSSQANVDDCALACSKYDTCDTFMFDGRMCFLKDKATIVPSTINSTTPRTAGWCPNGRDQYEPAGITITPAPAPYMCSNTTREVCKFPFKLNGQIKWDCVHSGPAQRGVCNVKASYSLPSFTSTDTFHPCGKCSEPDGQDGVFYKGFPLLNRASNFKYHGVIDIEECQELCSLADGCNFIEYYKSSNDCALRYGIGMEHSHKDVFFGPKSFKTGDGTFRMAKSFTNGPKNVTNGDGTFRIACPFLIFLVGFKIVL